MANNRKILKSGYNMESAHLGYVLGVCYTDATLKNEGFLLLRCLDEDFAKEFCYHLKKWSGFEAKLRKRSYVEWKNIMNEVLFCSTNAMEFLRVYDLKKILFWKKKNISYFLRAVADAEGCVTMSEGVNINTGVGTSANVGMVNIASNNKKFLYLLRKLFSKFSIECFMTCYVKKGHISYIMGKKVVTKKDVWGLGIRRKKDLMLFKRYINFAIKRKREKLDKLIENILYVDDKTGKRHNWKRGLKKYHTKNNRVQYCSIVPTKFIGKIWSGCSHRHLILSHLIKKNNAYCKNYRTLSEKGHIIYLDNDYFELKKCPNIKVLVEKANWVKATYIILPDIFYKNDSDYSRQINSLFGQIPEKRRFKIAAVMTGKTLDKAINCFKFLLGDSRIDLICIPDRLLMQNLNMKRSQLLDILEKKFEIEKWVHLLALDDIKELPKLVRPYVVSIDSATAFKSGYFGVVFPNDMDVKRPKDYFEIKDITKKQRYDIIQNLSYINKICIKKKYLNPKQNVKTN